MPTTDTVGDPFFVVVCFSQFQQDAVRTSSEVRVRQVLRF